jgi:hypothetical protein
VVELDAGRPVESIAANHAVDRSLSKMFRRVPRVVTLHRLEPVVPPFEDRRRCDPGNRSNSDYEDARLGLHTDYRRNTDFNVSRRRELRELEPPDW